MNSIPDSNTPEPLTEMIAIGKKLNQSRLAQGLSVHELARLSGVSAGMISQIERGIANPSFNVITRLASALNLQIGILFEQKATEKPGCVVRKDERQRINVPVPNFVFELLTPNLDYFQIKQSVSFCQLCSKIYRHAEVAEWYTRKT